MRLERRPVVAETHYNAIGGNAHPGANTGDITQFWRWGE